MRLGSLPGRAISALLPAVRVLPVTAEPCAACLEHSTLGIASSPPSLRSDNLSAPLQHLWQPSRCVWHGQQAETRPLPLASPPTLAQLPRGRSPSRRPSQPSVRAAIRLVQPSSSSLRHPRAPGRPPSSLLPRRAAFSRGCRCALPGWEAGVGHMVQRRHQWAGRALRPAACRSLGLALCHNCRTADRLATATWHPAAAP